jgi:hypothetical protein
MTQIEISHKLLALSKVLLETEQSSSALYTLSDELQLLSDAAVRVAAKKSREEVLKGRKI